MATKTRRRELLNTFDREPNKPINAATVMAAVRRAAGASKFCVARALRQRPNSRTADTVQRVLDALQADGKVTPFRRCGMAWYWPARVTRKARNKGGR